MEEGDVRGAEMAKVPPSVTLVISPSNILPLTINPISKTIKNAEFCFPLVECKSIYVIVDKFGSIAD